MSGWGGVRPPRYSGKSGACSRCGGPTYLWPGVRPDAVLCTKCLMDDRRAEAPETAEGER